MLVTAFIATGCDPLPGALRRRGKLTLFYAEMPTGFGVTSAEG